MRFVAIAAALLIAACAHTPGEVRQSHFRFDFQSAQPRERAAACAARNAEGISTRFSTTIRPGVDHDTVEVIVHAGEGTVAVIDVSGSVAGSTTMRVWLTSNIGSKEDLQDYASYLANTIAKGC